MHTEFLLLTGLLASILHVISGPDHLAAVTSLVIETNNKAWKIGLFWGIGHLAGMLLIGVLFLLFKEIIPVDAISSYSEQIVAIVLIGIGIWAFYRIFNEEKSSIQHKNETTLQDPNYMGSSQNRHQVLGKQNILSALGIGILHGLAGIAHFLLLLPVLGFESKFESIQYILGFAIGTVLAMSIYALILDKLTSLFKYQQQDIFFKGIRFAGGLFAIIVGFYWLYLSL